MDVSFDGSTGGFAGRIEILEDRSGQRFRSEGGAGHAARPVAPNRHQTRRYTQQRRSVDMTAFTTFGTQRYFVLQ